MFRRHASVGVSLAALQVALLMPAAAKPQGGEQALPPVTVDAPQQAKRAMRKPGERVASQRHRTPRTAAVPERHVPVVVVSTEADGANASQGTPPIKQRFQLPQESFSITAKQIDTDKSTDLDLVWSLQIH